MRISVPQENGQQKLKEDAFVYFRKNRRVAKYRRSGHLQDMYFIDFDYYEKYEEQLIGATYIKKPSWAYASGSTEIIKQMNTTMICSSG